MATSTPDLSAELRRLTTTACLYATLEGQYGFHFGRGSLLPDAVLDDQTQLLRDLFDTARMYHESGCPLGGDCAQQCRHAQGAASVLVAMTRATAAGQAHALGVCPFCELDPVSDLTDDPIGVEFTWDDIARDHQVSESSALPKEEREAAACVRISHIVGPLAG